MIYKLYFTFLYQPLVNVLFWLYETVSFQDLGVAIILLTAIINIALSPISRKNIRNQRVMQKIQPQLKNIQTKHKDDPAKQYTEMMSLYKEYQISPYTGFAFIFLQILIIFPLYQVFLGVFKPESLEALYPFLGISDQPNNMAFGLLNLSQPNIVVVAFTAFLQFIQAKMTLGQKQDVPGAAVPNKALVYIGPVITLTVFYNLPAAVTLYWCATSVFGIIQLYWMSKQNKNT